MFLYGHDPSGWQWFVMSVGMILFWAALIAFGVLVFRALTRSSASPATAEPPLRAAPEEVLAERFARGEIDEEEYRRRLTVLRTDSSPMLDKK
jgi:putative membrane protein